METREALEDIAFAVTRLGVVMTPQSGEPQEAWGVLNPASVRAKDDSMHLFPRLVAQGNYSRIGHARVRFEGDAPMGVERLGIALEPHESYEVNQSGGGVEDPRVVYVPMLNRYVMTYTAYVPVEPRVALAVSKDLHSWVRLGPLRYEDASGTLDLTRCGNKDAAFFPDVVLDPQGVPSLALLHRPTTRVRIHGCECEVTLPPCGEETREYIWISYVPVAAVLADIANLTSVRRHEQVMAPEPRLYDSPTMPSRIPRVIRVIAWERPFSISNARPASCTAPLRQSSSPKPRTSVTAASRMSSSQRQLI